MAFLDNSGDLILDAVLTDAGRERLARGDGSFKIEKFALGDDEIDYSQYDLNNANGSAYFDIEILQTPIVEAMTNNTSSMRSRLITIPRTDLLFLPVVRLNDSLGISRGAQTIYYVAADEETEESLDANASILGEAVLFGENTDTGLPLVFDQGLDTAEVSSRLPLDDELVETQYAVKIDSRLARVANPANGNQAQVSSIDDDLVATYFFSLTTSPGFVQRITETSAAGQVIDGPRGTRLSLKLSSTIELNSNDFLFTQFGSTQTIGAVTYNIIDAVLRIEGLTTGYSLDLPVRFIKTQ